MINSHNFRFRNTIWPICLPEEASNKTNEWHQKRLTLAAYGENTRNDAENDDFLTEETFRVEENILCNGIYDIRTFDTFYEQIQTALPRLFRDNTIFCARVSGTVAGTCPGDSGGTLLTKKGSKSYVIATVHGSIEACDGSRFPSIFVRLDAPEILYWLAYNIFPENSVPILW